MIDSKGPQWIITEDKNIHLRDVLPIIGLPKVFAGTVVDYDLERRGEISLTLEHVIADGGRILVADRMPVASKRFMPLCQDLGLSGLVGKNVSFRARLTIVPHYEGGRGYGRHQVGWDWKFSLPTKPRLLGLNRQRSSPPSVEPVLEAEVLQVRRVVSLDEARTVQAQVVTAEHDLEALSRDDLVKKVQEHGFGDLGFSWLRNVVEAGGGSFDKLKPGHMIRALRNPDQFR